MNTTNFKNNYSKLDTCQVRIVKYNGFDYKIQKDKKGFEYIKVTQDGKRKIISLKSIIETEEDEVHNYIFNYGWRDNPDERLSKLAKEIVYEF